MNKKVKPRINKNKLIASNRDRIKGALFEAVLRRLLEKSGFSRDFHSDQFTKNLFKIKGRGATYKPDIVGVFQLGIPFINPILLIGEAKYYKKAVGLPTVREFLGSYIDFSQFPSMNLGAGGDLRYEVLFGTRFNYCPIMFSIHGFQQSAAGMMFTHGINYISYDNSEIMRKFELLIEDVLSGIKLSLIKTDDFKLFNSVESFQDLNPHLKKENYRGIVKKLTNYLESVSSIIGVLDLRFPVHILYEKKVTAKLSREVIIRPKKNGSFELINEGKRKIGEFTFMDDSFITKYLKYAKKKGFDHKTFRQIDIINKEYTTTGKEVWNLKQLVIQEEARELLLNQYTKPSDATYSSNSVST